MFYRWNYLSSITMMATAALLGVATTQARAIDGCRPATPCPCGVDGVCRPNIPSYGHYQTRWRDWPGDESQAGATPDATGPSQDETKLPPFTRPVPENEDLRGPAKTKSEKAKIKAETEEAGMEAVQPPPEVNQPLPKAEQPPLEVEQPLFEEDAAPNFDLQGNHVIPIPTDDAPPALPRSLQQASTQPLRYSLIANGSARQQQPIRLATATSPVPPAQPAYRQTAAARPQPVVQANAQMSNQLQLINPAAKSVVKERKIKRPNF